MSTSTLTRKALKTSLSSCHPRPVYFLGLCCRPPAYNCPSCQPSSRSSLSPPSSSTSRPRSGRRAAREPWVIYPSSLISSGQPKLLLPAVFERREPSTSVVSPSWRLISRSSGR
jgi:hypothetical protein